uniref:Cell division protein FtsH n=1 Tax=Strongyloides venezuelensis TaxID=75913 RepID=A0A0K0G5H7_STRVS
MCGDIISADNEMANSFGLSSRKTIVLVGKKKQCLLLSFFYNITKKALPINGKYYQEYREKALNVLRSVRRTGRIKEDDVTTLYNSEENYILANDIEDMLQKAGQEVLDFIQ